MKKLILLFVLFLFAMHTSHSQMIKFGFKGGVNFSDLEGDLETKTQTGFHFGALIEIKVFENFAIQPEIIYSLQGAKIKEAEINKINYNYATVPVLAKFYLISNRLCLEAGPQFSFLLDDNLDETYKTKSFDFAAAGGLGIHFTKRVFAQARYVAGLTDTTKDATVKNKVIQVSLGFTF